MSHVTEQAEPNVPEDCVEGPDFIILATRAMDTIGAAAATWPQIDIINPAFDFRALAVVDSLCDTNKGRHRITAKWRGKPVFISHYSQREIVIAIEDDEAELPGPNPDDPRALRTEWLIVIGFCTHFGCAALGQRSVHPRGIWDSWTIPAIARTTNCQVEFEMNLRRRNRSSLDSSSRKAKSFG